ncbi:MAG TPA: response regulator, partial [Longimicrobiales bacterium]|nr:response regulator [Longimicrobiales bacterium]
GSDRVLTVLLLLGFPVVVVLAWIFDVGPGGIHRSGAAAVQPSLQEPPAGGEAAIGSSWTVPEEGAEEEAPVTPEELPAAPLDPERLRRASLGFVRHELRTPINAIIGYAEMLLEDARACGDESGAALDRIRQGGRALLGHVEEILGAERIENETDDVASYAAQVHSGLSAPLEAVLGDAGQLLAVDAVAQRTDRTADLERIQSAARRLAELSANVVRIAERGPDVAPAPAARMSSLAEGVLAKIRPVRADEADEERQGTLLVVDDSPINRDLLAKQLARRGYLVDTAENGKVALEQLAERDFDLVLLDIIMPELDGVEMLRRMKADVRLRDIPVIMISSLDEIDSVIRCLEIGAADFLSKPFHPTLLDARIGASLAARRSRGRERAQRRSAEPAVAGRELVIGGAPPAVLARLRAGERRTIDVGARAAVLWCDVARITGVRPEPQARAAALEGVVARVRSAAAANRCECTLAQGTGLAVLAGFTVPAADAVRRLATAALALQGAAGAAPLRLGLHVGALCGATVGEGDPSYWLWGDALELARGLAGEAQPGSTLISAAAHGDLKDLFVSSSRGVIQVPGRGQTRAYLLERPMAPSFAGG